MTYYRGKIRNGDTDAEIMSLTAWSDSRLMWPMVRYHACNVLCDSDTIWNSGSYAPSSICIKLTEGPKYVTSVKLQAEMSPLRALVHHEIHVGVTVDTMRSVGCIKCSVSHGEWIRVAVNDNVQYVKIMTISSPSYVAWKRIRVYGEP